MGPLALLVVLGLASWIVTCIIVESVLFEGMRRRVDWLYSWSIGYLIGAKDAQDYEAKRAMYLLKAATGNAPRFAWYKRALVLLTDKLKYMVGCHLCTGMWVSLAISAFLPPIVGPWVVGWVLNGAIIKAVAHIALGAQHAVEAFTRSKDTPEPPARQNGGGSIPSGKRTAGLVPFDPASAW